MVDIKIGVRLFRSAFDTPLWAVRARLDSFQISLGKGALRMQAAGRSVELLFWGRTFVLAAAWIRRGGETSHAGATMGSVRKEVRELYVRDD